VIADTYDEIIIDGNINYFPHDRRARAVVKADNTVPEVSAASIIAKVARDAYMCEQATAYPMYGFEKHVGYGTSLHIEMLKLHGTCAIHRKSFRPIRDVLEAAL
jgi:ribonuclease HII